MAGRDSESWGGARRRKDAAPGMTAAGPHDSLRTMKTDLLVQQLSADELPAGPVAWCRAFADRPGLALFDSALRDERLGRYSFLGLDPFARLEADRSGVRLNGAAIAGDPFDAVANLCARYRVEPAASLPPFQTGV